MRLFERILILLWKDIITEVRRGYEILSSMAFILATALIVSHISAVIVSYDLTPVSTWVVLLFIAIFTSTMSFTREVDKNTIYGLRLLPISPVAIFIGKTIYTFIMVVMQGILYLFFLAVFSSNYEVLSTLYVITFITVSLNLSAVSSFTSALVMYAEGRSFLIPMIIFILSLPIMPVAAKISGYQGVFDWDYFLLLAETISSIVTAAILSSFILET